MRVTPAVLARWYGYDQRRASRRARFAEMRRMGMTLAEIGAAEGISRGRVAQILQRPFLLLGGVPEPDSPEYVARFEVSEWPYISRGAARRMAAVAGEVVVLVGPSPSFIREKLAKIRKREGPIWERPTEEES